MNLPADIFLSLRYLKPKRTLISIISLLSVMGPVLGVTILIVVISVMSGFDKEIRQKLLETQSHIQAYPGYGAASTGGNPRAIRNPDKLLSYMEDELDIEASPIIASPVLLQNRNQTEIKQVRGIRPKSEQQVTHVHNNVRGKYEIESGEALIGSRIAQALGVTIGDKILLTSPYKFTSEIDWESGGEISLKNPDKVFLPEEATVSGIFSMGIYDFDNNLIYLHIDQAAELTGLDWGNATSVHVKTPTPFNLEEYTKKLTSHFPGYQFVTWQEANKQLFNALNVEKNLMFFVLFFIVVVAAFCIAGTLITVVIQKTREIAIIKAVGLGSLTVTRIFLLQGAFIGFLGCAGGTALGMLLIRFRDNVSAFISHVMGVPIFPPELYHLNRIPAVVNFYDIALILVLTFITCIFAALLPALYAAVLSPARALQDEA